MLKGQQDEIVCNNLCLVEYTFDKVKAVDRNYKNREKYFFQFHDDLNEVIFNYENYDVHLYTYILYVSKEE